MKPPHIYQLKEEATEEIYLLIDQHLEKLPKKWGR